MPQTPTFALRYPAPTDPADVPADVHNLASDVEAALNGNNVKPSYGVTLPASPVDGQEAILVDSVTAPTYQWRFRFNSQHSSDAYKWEFVGGAAVRAVGGNNQLALGGSSATTLPDVALTVPRSGVYDCRWFAATLGNDGTISVAADTMFLSVVIAGSGGAALAVTANGPYGGAPVFSSERRPATAGQVATLASWSQAGLGYRIFAPYGIELLPVRVS